MVFIFLAILLYLLKMMLDKKIPFAEFN